MGGAVDSDFADAIHAAAIGNLDKLVTYLRDLSRTVGPAERAWLADLEAGEFDRPRGAPAIGPGNQRVVRAVARYRELRVSLGKEEAAARQVADEMERSASTIREWDRLTREREAALAAGFQNKP